MTLVSFWIAALSMLFFPAYLPSFHLLYFAPYLVICFYRQSQNAVLLRAFLCGLYIDLFSASLLFGATPLAYCLSVLLLYGQRRNFFEEKLSTVAVLTTLFSMVASTNISLFYLIFGSGYSFSITYLLSDLIEMPILDGLYAFSLFTLPFQLIKAVTKLKTYAYFRKGNRG